MNQIRIIATGDFHPNTQVEEKLQHTQDPYDLFGEALQLLQSGDLTITNLEYPLTDCNDRLCKNGPYLRGHPSTISIIKSSGINILSLANNHILNCCEQGLKDTLSLCEANGISTVGAGMTLEDAQKILYKEINGVKIAFIAFCESEFTVATKNHGGAAPMDLIDNLKSIKEAKRHSDIVILLIHGGNEHSHYPSPRIVKQYRFYIDQGASAIIAHHPHYIQGFEFYKGKPILYSLCHLMFTRKKDPGTLEVPIAELLIDPELLNISVEFHFYRISLEETKLVELSQIEEMEMRNRFDRYCSVIKDPAALEEEWKKYCKSQEDKYYKILFLMPKVLEQIFTKFKLNSPAIKLKRFYPRELLRMLNVIRCESHRDVALSLLDEENEAVASSQ